MKVAISGARDYPGGRYMEILRELRALDPTRDSVVLGDAMGVDFMARRACEELGLHFEVEEAHWGLLGRAAGPRRNAAMLDHRPDVVWVWHHNISRSKGTTNMIVQAERRGIRVINKTPKGE